MVCGFGGGEKINSFVSSSPKSQTASNAGHAIVVNLFSSVEGPGSEPIYEMILDNDPFLRDCEGRLF